MSAQLTRTYGACVLTAALLVAGGEGRADERSEARDHYAKGVKEFDLGLYGDAVTEYMAAYKLRDDPALLYNIAQAYRLAGNPKEALRFYKVYVHKLPDASNRREVDDRIEELQKLVDEENAAKSRPPDQPRELQPDTARASTAIAFPAAPLPAAPSAADRLVARRMKVAGAVTAGAGVALLAAGIALGVVAHNAGDGLTALDTKGGTFDPALESRGKSDQAASTALLGVGGAAALAGAVVLGLGFRHGRAPSQRALVLPIVGPRMSGAALILSF